MVLETYPTVDGGIETHNVPKPAAMSRAVNSSGVTVFKKGTQYIFCSQFYCSYRIFT